MPRDEKRNRNILRRLELSRENAAGKRIGKKNIAWTKAAVGDRTDALKVMGQSRYAEGHDRLSQRAGRLID